ncbi:MAG TPA: hypothetical protein VHT03_09835 [Rhizomicrobium sp.]|nr:hypothetical protein [Rhizomicrobium sp.]
MPQERTVGGLATAWDTDLKRLHYHVITLAKLGLLTVSGHRRRAGRTTKLYRASAPAFFVPVEFAVESPSATLALQMQESLVAARRRADGGFLYHLDDKGEPKMRTVAFSKSGDATAETWRVLALPENDARQLSKQIAAVLNSYAGRSGGGWLVHFALCPSKLPRARRRTP